jgi:hypothetical protein
MYAFRRIGCRAAAGQGGNNNFEDFQGGNIITFYSAVAA